MPISHSEQVFNLIKSLTTVEKRNFRFYAKRIQDNENLLFLQLFDLFEKQKELDEDKLIKGLNGISKSKFSNLKRHLYSQVIASLRLIHKEKRANFKVREYLDFAYILYGKGLYLQALKILNKARALANKHHLIYMQLTIIEFEKKIEGRHITRSGSNKANILIEESENIQNNAIHLVRLSNLRIKMHAKYLENGHVKNSEETRDIKAYYQEQLASIDLRNLGLVERIFYVQSRVWYYYILLDFKSCMKHAIEWVHLLDENPLMIERDKDLYMRGIHYVLTTAIHMRDFAIHSTYLKKIEAFRKETYGTFNTNSQIISFLYVHTARLDNIILSGNFHLADLHIPRSIKRIKRYDYKLDDHRILVLYFKFAWIYLGNGNAAKAIIFLNKIINNELKKLREDLQDYARLLQLICHYELDNLDILDYLLQTYSSYFNRKKSINSFSVETLNMFNSLKSKGPSDHKGIFEKYHRTFTRVTKDKYDNRALVHLDMLSWLESKIKGISLKKVIQSRS